MDWIVIGSTKFSSKNFLSNSNFDNHYKLSEGDLIKLGKITFLIRKIAINKNDNNLKETKKHNELKSFISIDNCNSNCNFDINMNNSLNEEIAIYNKMGNNDINCVNTNLLSLNMKKEMNMNKNDKNKNNNLSNTVNNKLKSLYLKIKNVNEKQKLKTFKCRICFCEGSFEGKNPLISPCKCTGSVTYIHLYCLRKWLTSKITTKVSSTNNIYCYTFKSLECEICKAIIPEIVEYRGKFISLLEFKDVEPPYIIMQTMYQYNSQNRNISDLNVIFVISFKVKNYITIGRANYTDIRLSEVSVSRFHSNIIYFDENIYIEDLRSKFGTLLLIQNNLLFLPYKEISIQTGKCHLMFKLTRTCLGLFKCYKNKLYEKMVYENYLNSKDKKVYIQILENYNNNIVDPVEKFSTISGSCSASENNNTINEDDDKVSEENNEIKENNEDEKTEKLSKNIGEIDESFRLKYMFENSINSNKNINNKEYSTINHNESNIPIVNEITTKINNNNDNKEIKDNKIRIKIRTASNFFIKKLSSPSIDINNKNINNSMVHKHNESNDILFNDMKSTYNNIINDKQIKHNYSSFNILNVFKRKNMKKKLTSVFNIKYSGILNTSLMSKKDIENIAQANTQRENAHMNKKINE